MATFEETNRLRLEGVQELSQYGNVKDLSVTRVDTSYVLLATFEGKYKKTPPENLHIGPVRVISVKDGAEEPEEIKTEGPKNPEHKDPAQQHLDEPKDVNEPRAAPKVDKDKVEAPKVETKAEPKVEPKK